MSKLFLEPLKFSTGVFDRSRILRK